MGKRVTVQGKGEYKGGVLHLQGLEVKEDFLPVTSGNSDVILGVQWLKMVSTFHQYYKHILRRLNMPEGLPLTRGSEHDFEN